MTEGEAKGLIHQADKVTEDSKRPVYYNQLLTSLRTATRASTSLSSASSGPPSRARARWVRRNISPVFCDLSSWHP